jgi:hypothetical protein
MANKTSPSARRVCRLYQAVVGKDNLPMIGNAIKMSRTFGAFFASSAFLVIIVVPTTLLAQAISQAKAPQPGAVVPHDAAQNGWVVRDPTTGRMFHQQLADVNVPMVRWESKPVTTTVMQPQWVTQVIPQTQTVYQPQTQTLLQPYWIGRWNPFRQPTLAYRLVSTTSWHPVHSTTNRVIATQQWVPKQQTVQVPQPVAQSQVVQQLVQTEIPQPQHVAWSGARYRGTWPTTSPAPSEFDR